MSFFNWFNETKSKKNFPKASYQRLLRRAGIQSISKTALEKIDNMVSHGLEDTLRKSAIMSNIRNSNTVSYNDVNISLKIQNMINMHKNQLGGANYQVFCDSSPSQCVDDYVPPTCSGGGGVNYQGFCDSSPSQCVDDYVPPTCSGGGGVNYQGFCDSSPSQCVDDYVPPTCSRNYRNKQKQKGGRFNTYDGFCQNEMGQCSDSFRSCSGGGKNKKKNKKQKGGRFNTYDGFCQNEIGQCSDSFRSCSGGGKNKKKNKYQKGGEGIVYKGFCSDHPSQCIDTYVPPTCTGGSHKGFYGNFNYNYIDNSNTFSIPKTTFDRISRKMGKELVHNWTQKDNIRFSSPGLDRLHHILENNIVSQLQQANMKARARGSSRVNYKDL